MKTIGNVLWLVLGGFVWSVVLFIVGIAYCLTIFLIPIGLGCFKMAGYVLWPFGKEIKTSSGTLSTILNVIWIIFGGFEMALGFVITGLLLFLTIIGIPFAKIHFELARLCLFPVGAEVVKKR